MNAFLKHSRLVVVLSLLATGALSAQQQSQTISFDAIPNQILGVSPFPIYAVPSSSLPVGFASLSRSVCTVTTNLVLLRKSGTCTIQATQTGNGGFSAAAPVSRSFQVNPAGAAGTLIQVGGTINTGLGPTAIASGYFNGDAHLDYAVTSFTASTVQVLTGDGRGGFTSGSYSVGSGPVGVVAGDFNNDGFTDLATANANDGTVSILINNGDGTFTAGTSVALTAGLTALVVGDFDSDGIADLAVLNSIGNVTILKGSGKGTFVPSAGGPLATGSSPNSLATGDFNADGIQDLVVTNTGNNSLSIFTGNGSGRYTRIAGPAPGVGPKFVTVGDFDRDGRQDIAVANGGDGTVSVFLQTAPGTFTAAKGSPFAVAQNPSVLAVGDYNGDGFQDLAVANTDSNTVTILLGNGSGGFTPSVGNFSLGAGPSALASGDVNGDGVEDLAVVNNADHDVFVFAGSPVASGSFISTTSALNISAGQTVDLTDSVTAGGTRFGAPAGPVVIFDGTVNLGTSSQSASPYTFTTPALAPGTHQFTAVYQGDGHYTTSTSNTITIRATAVSQIITFNQPPNVTVNAGSGNLTATTTSNLPITFTSAPVAVCTVSGAVVTYVSVGTCTVSADQPGNSFYAPATTVTRTFTIAAAPTQTIKFDAVADHYLGTGPFALAAQSSALLPITFTSTTTSVCRMAQDLVIMVQTGTCSISANQPGGSTGGISYPAAPAVTRTFKVNAGAVSGTFTPVFGSPFTAGNTPYAIALADFDGDGIQDIAIANYGSNDVTVLRGGANGSFTPFTGSPFSVGTSAGPTSVVTGDFNGDGFADIATANQLAGNVTVLLGNGTGTVFQNAAGSPYSVSAQPTLAQPTSLAVADFNGDGIQDLAVAEAGVNKVGLLFGNGTGRMGNFTEVAGGVQPNSIAVGDFNNDGKVDLVVCSPQGSVTVLLGTGVGGFTTSTNSPFTTASGSLTVAVGDFNQDGKQDLAVGNSGTPNITILLGDGAGGFSTGATLGLTATPASITVGDFNGDGKPDLAVATSAGILEFTGNGAGGFAASVGGAFLASNSISAVAGWDFNGDGRLDVAAATVGINGVSVLLGGPEQVTSTLSTQSPLTVTAGSAVPFTIAVTPLTPAFNAPTGTVTIADNGTFAGTAPQNSSPYSFSFSSSVAGTHSITANYGGDSRASGFINPGAVVITVQAAQVSQTITFNPLSNVVYGSGNVTLSAVASSKLAVTFTSTTSGVCTVVNGVVTLVAVGVCSINADQSGDASYLAAPTVTQSFLINQATQTITFDAIPNQLFGASPFPIAAQSDHLLKVTFTSQTPTVCGTASGLAILRGTGTCTIQASQAGDASYAGATSTRSFTVTTPKAGGSFGSGVSVAAGTSAQAIGIGDFNADGKLDIAVADAFSPGGVSLAFGDGTGGFPAGNGLGVGSTPLGIAIGDFNGDGKLDFVTPNQGANTLTIALGNGNGSFTTSTISLANGTGPDAVAIGDFNSDGIQDLAVANGGTNNVTIFFGDGAGGFAVNGSFVAGNQPRSIVVGDFNNDGFQDLAIANQTTNNVTVLSGDGSGSFSPAANSPFDVGRNPTTLVIGDFNGDGKQDLAVANNTAAGSISILLGTGTGSFTTATGSPFGSGKFAGLTVGDFNGDGISDLVASDATNNLFAVFQGDGTGAFTRGTSSYATGQLPVAVAAVDLNGDGFLDVVTANSGSSSVWVRLGTGPVAPTPQTITFAQPPDVTITESPVTLSATASSGLSVNFASATTAICTVSGTTVNLVAAGTCTIKALQGGDSTYAAAPTVTLSFTITAASQPPPPPTLLSQTISFTTISNVTVGSGPVTISATASSGLQVTFVSVGPCSVSGNTVSFSDAGTCSITAYQTGNSVYSAANPVTQSFQIAAAITITTSSLPSGIVGKPYGPVGLTATGGSGGLTWSLNGGSLPDGVSLSGTSISGASISGTSISGTPGTAGSFPFSVKVVDSLGASAIQSLSITINPAVKITTSSIVAAIQGVAYSQNLAASGGTGSYAWSVSGGSLPTGISLSAGGAIAGTASTAGSFSFTAQVTDGVTSASQGFTLTVSAPVSITSSAALPSGVTGSAYSSGLSATGGSGGPYTWSVSAGTLPSGINLSSAGLLGGNPSTTGTFSFTVQVSDGVSTPATQGVSMTVYLQLSITTSSLPNGTVGVAYAPVTLAAKGGSGNVSWSATGAPDGLSLSAAGVLSGTPTGVASATLSVTAQDSVSGQSLTLGIPISVVPANTTLKVSPSTLFVGAAAGNAVSGSFTASGGTGPYTFAASGLPDGVSLSAGGIVNGSTASAGTYAITVTAIDSAASPATATAQLSLRILGFSTGALPNGAATVIYSASVGATGGTPPYTFSGAGLPDGLSISGNGNLSGTPSTEGTFTFSVQVADATGLIAAHSYTVSIGKAPVSVKATGLQGGAVGVPYSQEVEATGGNPPYTWSISSGVLPKGLSLSSSGNISGIPTAPGSTGFALQVQDSSGGVASGGESIVTSPAQLAVSIGALYSGVQNFSYGPAVLDAAGGAGPYDFVISDGALPPGLTLVGGAVSGLPTTAGTFPFTVAVTDSSGSHTTSPSSIVIRPAGTDLVLQAGGISFQVVKGAPDLPVSQSVGVQSAVVANPINYSIAVSPASAWFDVSGGTTTPGVLNISLTSAALSLPSGRTQAIITLTCTIDACQGKTQSINVSVSVTSPPPQLSILTGLLSFTSATTPPQAQAGSLELQNIGGGTVSVSSVTCRASWCSVGSIPGTLTNGTATAVNITVNPTGLASGFYKTALDVTSSAGSGSVPVTFFITQTASMTLAPAGIQFTMPAGGAPGNSKGSFQVSVVGNSVTWTASVASGAAWLNLDTASGSAFSAQPGVVNFTINPSAATLAPQAYYATIQVTSSGAANSPQNFQVILNVGPATLPAQLDPQPAGLVFVTTVGSTAAPQPLAIYANSVSAIPYQAAASTASGGANWLAVSPAVGSSSASNPGNATVSVDTTGLSQGVYTGGVSYATGTSGIHTVNVTLIVQAAAGGAAGAVVSRLTPNALSPRATCSPTKLVPTQTGLVNSFSAPASWPTPLSILLLDDCGGAVTGGQVVATFSNGDSPLAFNIADGSKGLYSATWTPRNSGSQVTINARSTKAGLAAATTQLAGAVVPNVTPTIDPNGVIHPFDPAIGGALAPGTVVSIYGSHLGSQVGQATSLPLPTKVNGTTVLIGGIPSPLFYVSPGQINVQVPFELDPLAQYEVIVNANGALTKPQSIQLTKATPGLDTFPDGSLVAVRAADGSLISASSPAHPGEYIVLFLLGMGDTDTQDVTGNGASTTVLSRLTNPAAITFNGNNVPVDFAGLAPGFVGLYQVNLKIPDSTPGGNLVVGVTQDGVAGNTGILPIAF